MLEKFTQFFPACTVVESGCWIVLRQYFGDEENVVVAYQYFSDRELGKKEYVRLRNAIGTQSDGEYFYSFELNPPGNHICQD